MMEIFFKIVWVLVLIFGLENKVEYFKVVCMKSVLYIKKLERRLKLGMLNIMLVSISFY